MQEKLHFLEAQSSYAPKKIKKLYLASKFLMENPFRTQQQKKKAKDLLEAQFKTFDSLFKVNCDKKNKCMNNLEPKGFLEYAKAYKCETCSKQDNSVICLDCFQQKKHFTHRTQLINVKRGSCDCGDVSKWAKESFCQNHRINHKSALQFMDQKTQLYSLFFQHSLKILSVLYFFKKQVLSTASELTKIQIDKTDLFGRLLMQTLIGINTQKSNLNNATLYLMNQKLNFNAKLWNYPQIQLKYLLLMFIQLKQTSKKCIEFLILLFSFSQNLRKDITLSYFTLYSQVHGYIRSNYNKLSAQLLTNSTTIYELLNQKSLSLCFKFIDLQNLDIQKRLQLFSNDLNIYFRHLKILISIQSQSCKSYWKKQILGQGLIKIVQSYQAGKKSTEELELIFKKYYHFQVQFLKLWALIVDKLLDDKQFCQTALQRITEHLLKEPQDIQQGTQYFTLQRMWGHLFFAYLHQYKQRFKQRLDKIIQVSKQDLIRLMKSLFKQSVDKIYKISQIMKSTQSKDQKLSFAKAYFMRTGYSLFSIDAFILRIAVFQLKSADSFQSSQFMTKTLDEILKKYTQSISKLQISSSCSQTETEKQVFFMVSSLSIYINLYQQSLHSNLVKLYLLTNHPKIIEESPLIQQKYLNFYLTIYKSLKQQMHATQFRRFFQSIFFKESLCFDYFMCHYKNQFKQDQQLLEQLSNTQPINIEYFSSLMFKVNSKNLKYKFKDFEERNFLSPIMSINESNLWLQTSLIKVMKMVVKLIKLTKCHKQVLLKKIYKALKRLYIDYNQPQYEQFLKNQLINFNFGNTQYLKSQQSSNQSSIYLSELFQKQSKSNFSIFDKESKQRKILDLIQTKQQQTRMKNESLLYRYYFGTCIYKQKCINMSSSQLYLLSFVNYSKLHHDFSTMKAQSALTFVSCSHSCHMQCYHSYSKQAQVQSCLTCGKNYNCLLSKKISCQQQHFGFDQIQKQFQRIAGTLDDSQILDIQKQIFFSIFTFLLKSVVVDDFDFYTQNTLIYRDLFLKFRQFVRHKNQRLNEATIFKIKFDFTQTFQSSSFVHSIAEKLKHLLWESSILEEGSAMVSQAKQTAFIDQILNLFTAAETKWKIYQTKQKFLAENMLFDSIKKLLPNHLSQIAHQAHIKCSICKKSADFLYICLLHPVLDQLPLYSFCETCFQLNVIEHIKQYHNNQMLYLQTDSGRPTYLFVDKISQQPTNYFKIAKYRENKYLYSMPSLYQNEIGKAYFPKNYQDKSEYFCSEQKIRDLVDKMTVGTYALLASNQYK